MKITSARANKLLKSLNDEKNFIINKEREGCIYIASETEAPVIPDYDYNEVTARLKDIDEKIVVIKHTLNVVNTTNTVYVNGKNMTIDEILVRMAQLNARKSSLDYLRNRQEKRRLNNRFNSAASVPEYEHANFDIKTAQADYNRIDNEITNMQLALDRFNHSFEFEVDVEL